MLSFLIFRELSQKKIANSKSFAIIVLILYNYMKTSSRSK
ncbi:hypothetical protein HMPREF1863_00140 [Aedoeadaptatus coxii]|uniref:Uncharacterized protein n=1 Tax=Aedoeadaptatus coxii TaxID=755172 RepID=A0A134AL46_9FIRM|nr:hypothetical protein HMPREF1863_00140 [Peptoniphilus coxii]